MNALKRKVFTLIFSILSISILGFIIVFNVEKYIESNRIVSNSLRNFSNNEENKNRLNKDNTNKMVMLILDIWIKLFILYC